MPDDYEQMYNLELSSLVGRRGDAAQKGRKRSCLKKMKRGGGRLVPPKDTYTSMYTPPFDVESGTQKKRPTGEERIKRRDMPPP